MASSVTQLGKTTNSPVISSVEDKIEKEVPEISKRILDILNSANHSKKKKQLAKDFTTISVEDISAVLENYFQEATEKINKKDPSKIIDELAKIIPFEKLQEAVCGDKKTALETAKSMLHQAKYYLKQSNTKASYSVKARISDIIDSILSACSAC